MDDVRRVLLRSPPKTCVLDPLPTSILRDVVDTLLPFIWVICNNSLQEGCLPTSQKAVIITPVLKKPGAGPVCTWPLQGAHCLLNPVNLHSVPRYSPGGSTCSEHPHISMYAACSTGRFYCCQCQYRSGVMMYFFLLLVKLLSVMKNYIQT